MADFFVFRQPRPACGAEKRSMDADFGNARSADFVRFFSGLKIIFAVQADWRKQDVQKRFFHF